MAIIWQKEEVVWSVYSIKARKDVYNLQLEFYIEKDLADPVQITKDVERSLYYYPQG